MHFGAKMGYGFCRSACAGPEAGQFGRLRILPFPAAAATFRRNPAYPARRIADPHDHRSHSSWLIPIVQAGALHVYERLLEGAA